MRIRLPILLGATVLAMSALPGHAADDAPGFNELDRDGDGSLSRTEAAGNTSLAARFQEVDADGDGKLSRVEYLKTAAAQDIRKLRERAAEVIEPDKDKGTAASGGTQRKER